ncbi:putative Xaa-Pro aminopeptidase P [Wickerhamiella sorbophila]|uniref:Putative Xaa-Pro aminopeptidase P n=1 Tax=Wickerhamiella sorbophila TaxID=45607 RepID=A0A2T0FHS5_9ASCO|nr:putative Xaa-Pro aminopeptidase P [Wickerhamiella sorbophila]PRT54540.1 putative Xaa-Pro aminopeptidase P [Wickerhamiella sorbophila]
MSTVSPIEGLRARMSKHNIGYYLVLTQDEHNSEYVAEADERRAFISGFTGSAGTAVIGLDSAELATDGRYYLQAEKQLPSGWSLRKEGSPNVDPWFKAVVDKAKATRQNIGVDPKLIRYSIVESIQEKLVGSGIELKAIPENLVDAVWTDKPALPKAKVISLAEKVTGKSFEKKLSELRDELEKKHAKAILLTALDDIAWLFNLRGSDIDYNPVFKSFALVSDHSVTLYVDEAKVVDVKDAIKNVEIKPYNNVLDDAEALAASVATINQKAKEARSAEAELKLWLPAGSSWALVEAAGGKARTISDTSPITIAKAKKNCTEIDGQRSAQLKCGLSVVRYLAWADNELKNGNTSISEYEGSQKLLEIRKKLDDFVGPSFETISSVGPNAAVIHYAPQPDSKHCLSVNEVHLLDSGCQFTHGTTDTTRTVHFGNPTPEEINAYTLVLKGHIALARAVFPEGTNGYQLDTLARQHLWRQGLDYRHGTGHGVGAFLNVHEGPMGIGSSPLYTQVPLEIGHLISNEPGYYEDNKFGIRIESLVVVRQASTPNQFNNKKYLEFETVTLVPLARNLIDVSLLDENEREWINCYHSKVEKALLPHLDSLTAEYVKKHTAAI